MILRAAPVLVCAPWARSNGMDVSPGHEPVGSTRILGTKILVVPHEPVGPTRILGMKILVAPHEPVGSTRILETKILVVPLSRMPPPRIDFNISWCRP